MIWDPALIYYACIAKGTTVLTEFNSKDAALGAIAVRCLEKTPPFHSTFTHTIRSKTYTFLIDERFVYFLISHEKLENSEALGFLKSSRDAFGEVLKNEKNLKKLSSYCYQGEFNPVFHQLLGSGLDHTDGISSPMGQRMGQSGILHCGLQFNGDDGWKKMKNWLFWEFNGGRRNSEEENYHTGGKGFGLSREFSLISHKNGGLHSPELMGLQNSKQVWKKQVCFVLSLDFIICVILFVVWLWICSGFECIAS
ncbi:phytolongin Phyl2.2-like [Primulina eburnea]|uniref:phytolongin Phyl2.2-like n=1 Tax=Primulina eburnea TaxID=1245227 RepID=UPI003C6C408A